MPPSLPSALSNYPAHIPTTLVHGKTSRFRQPSRFRVKIKIVGGGGFTCPRRTSTEFWFCQPRSCQSWLFLANCKFPVAHDGKTSGFDRVFCVINRAGSFPKVPEGDWNRVVFEVSSSPNHSMKLEWGVLGECEAGASSSSIWFFNSRIRTGHLGLDHQHLIK